MRAIFLDADGVLWPDIGSGGILSGQDHSIQNLGLLYPISSKQYLKIVISNQTYAARKKMNYVKFKLFSNTFFKNLIKQDLLDDFAICYHHPNAENFFLQKKCDCRKPLPGLINLMVEKHNISPEKSFLIGDRITDIQAGTSAGCMKRRCTRPYRLGSAARRGESRPLCTPHPCSASRACGCLRRT